MNDNLLRKAVDARLSGLTFTPQMQADTLRRAHPAGSTRMGRKLSYSLAFALLALLLAATAGAAAYFGVLHFHGEQENNAVYQRHILSIGERLTGQNTTVTVNDAVRRFFPLLLTGYRPRSEYPGGLSLPARDGHAGWPRHRDPCDRIPAAFRG